MRVARHPRGYLVAVLSILVALVSIGFLSLAAYSARSEDKAELRRSRLSALYAAESGLLTAREMLVGLKAPPPPGIWVNKDLSRSLSKFKVEVLAEGRSEKSFRVISVGRSVAEGDRIESVTFEAQCSLKNKVWQIDWHSHKQ